MKQTGRKKGCIRQQDATDCGAACLASVAALHGSQVPLARIRQLAGTSRKGTNALGMVEAARAMGFTAKAVRASGDALSNVPLPAIAHVIRGDFQHFVVLTEVYDQIVETMDPAEGSLKRIRRADFQSEWTGILILIQPATGFVPDTSGYSTLRKWKTLLKPTRSILILSLLGAAVFSALGLTTAIYVQKIVDQVLQSRHPELLHMLSLGTVLLLIARVFTGFLKNTLTLKCGQILDAALIMGYYKHLLKLPQSFFDTMRTGEILSRVNDAVKIRYFINNLSQELLVNTMIFIGTSLVMLFYSWKLTLITFISIPFFGVIYLLTNRINKQFMRKSMENAAELESQLVESVQTISTIHKMGMENSVRHRTEKKFVRLLNGTYQAGQANILTSAFSQFLSGSVTIASLWYGSSLVMDQELSTGTLMSFYALTGYMLGPLQALIGANQGVQDALIAADRLFQIMDLEQQESDEGKMAIPSGFNRDILIDDISFRYNHEKEVFEHLSLMIPQGKITVIAGESGSGKSTLAALIQKVYPLQKGRIFIGDLDLNSISGESLHQYIATVPQDIHLFAGSVLENIAPGDAHPDLTRVEQLCRTVGIHSFIERLPESYHTHLGENGLSLSGGEKQRIAIARALYKNPQLILLDEATSSLDSLAEKQIQETFSKLRSEGKTIIIIAHRLSTARTADKILLLKNGKLTEEGTHTELIALHGDYHRLWQSYYPEN